MILGKDEDNFNSAFFVTGCNYEVGNVFKMYKNQKVSSISIYIGPNSKEGADIKGTVYDYFDINTTPSEVVSTPSYYLTGPDTLGGWITLRFLANVELTAGSTYLVAAANITADAFIGLSGKSVAPEEVIYYNVGGCSNCSGELCVLESVPMVRLNFEYPVGIGEEMINLGVSVYPNPANDGQFSINFSNAKKDVYSLEMKNMLGQVVYAENLNVQGSIVKQVDVKQLRKGVYFLNINNSNTTGTQKIIIN